MKYKAGQLIVYEETIDILAFQNQPKRAIGFISRINKKGYYICWCDHDDGDRFLPLECEYLLDKWVMNYSILKDHL